MNIDLTPLECAVSFGSLAITRKKLVAGMDAAEAEPFINAIDSARAKIKVVRSKAEESEPDAFDEAAKQVARGLKVAKGLL